MSIDVKKKTMHEVILLATEYLEYLDIFGNECAYTDSILRLMNNKIVSIDDFAKEN